MVLRRTGRALGVLAFTAVEVAGLAAWLAVARGTVETALPAAAAPVLLIGALVLEGVLTHVTVNGFGSRPPVGAILAFSASETVLWVAWLAAADAAGGSAGLLGASALLAVVLVPQHTLEDNVLRGDGLLSELFDAGTLRFSVVEAAAAAAWLALVAGGEGALDALSRRVGGVTAAGLGEPVPALLDLLAAAGVDPGAALGVGLLAVLLAAEHAMGVRYARR